MTQIPIYIEMDEETETILSQSGLSIQEILSQNQIDARVTYGKAPFEDEQGRRTKDVATIILASAGAAFLISKAITNILREIHYKPIHDEYWELVPVTDANGNVIMDPETGNPVMRPKKFHYDHEFSRTDTADVTAGLKGLVMKFGTKQGK